MEIEQTKAIIEAILFAAGRPVTENELMLNLELSKDDIKQIIESMKEDSNNLYMQPSTLTPRIFSISALVMRGLYAIIDNVSNAAFDKLGFVLLSIIG